MKNLKSNTYQFQTIGGRKFNIIAMSIEDAENKALEWKKANAPKSSITYNFRIN